MASRFFRLKKDAGDHYMGTGDAQGGQRMYQAGDVIESEQDLIKLFPNKFIEINPKSKNAKDTHGDKFTFPTLRPARGVPTRFTKSPRGPEETPNSESEIMEVDQAIEEDDTEEYPKTRRSNVDEDLEGQGPNKHKGTKTFLRHQKKKGRISDEDETEETAIDDAEDDEEVAKSRPKSKRRSEEDYAPVGEEEEGEEDDEYVASTGEEEEEEPTPKKSSKKKKKSKKNRE